MAKVLVADHDPEQLRGCAHALASAGHTVTALGSTTEALRMIAGADVDVVLTDVAMPEISGLQLCAHVVGNRPDVPVIVMTADARVETAVAAIRAGAYDFLVKPVAPASLFVGIERAARHRELAHRVNVLRRADHGPRGLDDILGRSQAMRHVFEVIERVADSEASVLITGASGTGKELVANALHRNSRRRAGPFVSINCAALPEPLLESELFGHARGAFTDAKQAHDGLFAKAHGGTLFLDEIGDMPVGLQPKLLRVLQERRVRPVGSTAEQPVDVRIVAATNQDLQAAVDERRFRSDLFFRINVVHIGLPPLRTRDNDILQIAQHFLERYAEREGKDVHGLAPAAAEKLLAYDWPGNARELQNCMERAIALARYDEIGPDDLPERIRDHSPVRLMIATDDAAGLLSLQEVERRYIARVLTVVDGNKTTAARVLGIDRKTLYRKLAEHEPVAVSAARSHFDFGSG